MLALDAKRGVEATLERIYNNTGKTFTSLKISWTGSTAGVSRDGDDVHVIFPGIDETQEVENGLFSQLIGYALHELGHVWFTTDEPWHEARELHGAFVSSLINGLEDPRIEQCVINSGYAPNARALFEYLTNKVLEKGGYVEADDFKNIPFMLAIEGRRLNGYQLGHDSILDDSPYQEHLRWALSAAHFAKNTYAITQIAIELNKRLQQQEQEQGDKKEQGDEKAQGKQEDKQEAGQKDSKSDKTEQQIRPVEPDSYISEELQPLASEADKEGAYYYRPHAGKPIIRELHFI